MKTPPKDILYYLAHPYSAKTPEGEAENANDATLITARLFEAGFSVYSPLTHCHPINNIIHYSWDKWMQFDTMLMDRCDAIILCKGWENSRGCNEERWYFMENDKPIYLVEDFI